MLETKAQAESYFAELNLDALQDNVKRLIETFNTYRRVKSIPGETDILAEEVKLQSINNLIVNANISTVLANSELTKLVEALRIEIIKTKIKN
jgi:hypothetical protein